VLSQRREIANIGVPLWRREVVREPHHQAGHRIPNNPMNIMHASPFVASQILVGWMEMGEEISLKKPRTCRAPQMSFGSSPHGKSFSANLGL